MVSAWRFPDAATRAGLGLHDHVISVGDVQCCGAFVVKNIALTNAGDGEFDISNVGQVPMPADAFLVPASCVKLFDGDYPGSVPLCTVYLGPVLPKSVSKRIKLDAGTYRLWVQSYTANTASANFYIDIGVYDYRCLNTM